MNFDRVPTTGRGTAPIIAVLSLAGAAAVALSGCQPAAEAAGSGGTTPAAHAAAAATSRMATTTSGPAPATTRPATTAPATTRPTATAPHTTAATTAPAPHHRHSTATTTGSRHATGAPCSAAADACVSLSDQEAWLLHDGTVVYGPVPVATGRAGWETPAGTFHVQWKARNWVSTVFHAPMPYSVFFYEGDAFHEGSVYVRSHGCVHLRQSAAATFFDTLQVGDEVQVVW